MSYYDDASLVLIPSGVKASKVYSQKPTNGNGDLTFTRASTATRTNESGVIESVASNVPRLDYRNADGTVSTCPRLLLEPQRTNGIRNSTMVGAVAGTPGTLPSNWSGVAANAGLSQEVVSIGTENGINYIDIRFTGTATGPVLVRSMEQNTQIAALPSQSWTLSSYVKSISGTISYSNAIIFRTSAGAGLSTTDNYQNITSTLSRTSTTATSPANTAFAQPLFFIALTIGETYDFTIRIAAPQMELGAYATTFIPTTTAAVTRLADAFSRSNIYTNGFISDAGGTWLLDFSGNLAYARDSALGLYLNQLGNNTGFGFHIVNSISRPSEGRLSVRKLDSSGNSGIYTTLTDNVKIAIKWNGTTADVFANGVKVLSATSFTPTNMQFLSADNRDVPKYINQSALFPVPLTDDQCIEITTL